MTKLNFKKVNITSPDQYAERLAELRRIMPDLFDGDGNLEKQAIEQFSDPAASTVLERFRFEWAGKQESKRRAFSPSKGTLVADKSRSVKFDETENLILEGDNLEVLKLLQTTYFEQVKCIYIDPPYNTGNDFIYQDTFTEEKGAYWQKIGAIKEGVKLIANTESCGRKHSNWLNMMQSRLYAARSLLSKDGAIVVHIDENECHRLHFLLEEVFGNENFLGEVVWDKRNPKGDSGKISYQHESILFFAKNLEAFKAANALKVPKKNAKVMLDKAAYFFSLTGRKVVPPNVLDALAILGLEPSSKYETKYTLKDANEDYRKWITEQGTSLLGGEAAYKHIDTDGKVYQTVSMAWPNNKKAPDEYFQPLIHPITKKCCPVPKKGWRNPPETMQYLLDRNRIVFGSDESTQPRRKYLLEENMSENLASVIYYGASDDQLLNSLGIPFENPKPVEVAKRLMSGMLNENDIVLDFFAGSGTTGHAIMEMNSELGSNLRFILVQVPELVDEKHAAFQARYKTISALCIDRVKKAGEIIKATHPKMPIDTGFRVYCLTSSFFPENLYVPDLSKSKQENMAVLKSYLESATQTRLFDTDELVDIISEISLKNGYGLFFTLEHLKDTFFNNVMYRLIGNGKNVLLCLDTCVDDETVETLVSKYAQNQLIVSKLSLDTAKTWTLKNAFGDNLRVV